MPLDDYLASCAEQIAEWNQLKGELEDKSKRLEVCRSNEYATAIIQACVTGRHDKI